MDLALPLFAIVGLYAHLLYFASSVIAFLPLPRYKEHGPKLPKVSIIIAAMNEEKVIGKTLKSLKRLDYPDYEIIVVCQGNDKTVDIAKRCARVIRDKSTGKWSALNAGAKASVGDVLYILDADSVPDRGALKKLVSALGSHEVATGMAVEEGTTPTATVFRLQTAFTNHAQYFFSRFLGTGLIQGKNFVMRKKTLLRMGGFKKAVLEDANMTFRLYLAGKKIAVVDAECSELAPAKFAWYFAQQRRWAFSEQMEAKKITGKLAIKDWFTMVPASLTFGYAPVVSAIFAASFVLTKNSFFMYGMVLGYLMYLVSSIRFLKPRDVLLSPVSFAALCALQTYFNLEALLMILSGKKETGGRTEKA
ncbi:MAG: glycosyltransferase family 2 protein [Candidatus Aenigmarchaeota archaeon]|nr:glycosyltransferase family 2 protein [Candidatus Aenigmarchaeota archaeon]